MPAVTCPRCGAECDVGEALCPSCGRYLGVRRSAAQPMAPSEPEPEVPAGLAPVLWLLELFPGLVRPKVLVMALAALPVAAGLLWLALLLVGYGGIFAGMAIGGFAVVVYWTAVAWLLYGEICMPAEALAEFDGTKWMVFLLAAFAPMSAFFYHIGRSGP